MIGRFILIFEFILISIVATAQQPVVYDVTGGGSYCQGTGGLTVGLSNSQVGVTYTLIKDGNNQTPVVDGTGAAISFGNQSAGTYTISGTDGTATTSMSGSAVITVNALPTATFTGALTACVTTTLTAGTDAITPSYIWYKDNEVITGQTASTLDVTASGAYKVKVTNENGCEKTSDVLTVTINPLPTTSPIYHQ